MREGREEHPAKGDRVVSDSVCRQGRAAEVELTLSSVSWDDRSRISADDESSFFFLIRCKEPRKRQKPSDY